MVDGDAHRDGGSDVGGIVGDFLEVGGAGDPQGKEGDVQDIGGVQGEEHRPSGQEITREGIGQADSQEQELVHGEHRPLAEPVDHLA